MYGAGLASKEMMAKADRELYQFEAPQQELGLSDLISKHNAGERFQFLALTGGDSETFEARMRRMVTFKPRMNKTQIPLKDLPHIKLIDDTENLSLVEVMPKKSSAEYIRVASVACYFAPTVTVMSKFSKVKIALMDSRFDPPAEIQSITTNTNVDSKSELSMDYCVPKTAAAKLRLMISREQSTITFGEQWGALQAQIMLEETSFPYMSDMKQVVGILGPTASALEDHVVNPNILDITMTESNRKAIRELYQQGDIADESEPIKIKKKAITYAKSSMKALPKGELAESSGLVRKGWEGISDIRKPQIAAEEASVDPENDDDDDSDYNPTNRLKAKQAWEEEQERMRQNQEIFSETTEEIPRSFSPPPRKSAMKQPAYQRHDSITAPVPLNIDIPPAPIKKGVQFGAGGV